MPGTGPQPPGWYDAPVIVARVDSYDGGAVEAALADIVATAGGWDKILPPATPVLVKPNLMSAREPARAVTTHPAVTTAVAAAARAAGRDVAIGDSPAGAFAGLRRVWEATGAAAAAQAVGVPLVSFEAGGSVCRPVASRFLREIRVARACADAAVISCPKLKTHFLTSFTGAVKNLLGQVPGLVKSELHRRAPHPEDFCELLVDLLPAYAPAFTVADAIVGLEGDGPASGTPRPFRLLVGGANAAAVDVVLAGVLGLTSKTAPTVRCTVARGLTPATPRVIFVGGATAEDLEPGDVLPAGSAWLRRVPRPVLKLAGRQFVIRPVVTAARCTGCARCVASCPVGAAAMAAGAARIDAKRCIECLCCYETCADEAITLQPGGAARLYYWVRDARRARRRRRNAGATETEVK